MGSSMMSSMTKIGLDLAKHASKKTLSSTPSRRQVRTKCERSGTWILDSMIEDMDNIEYVRESSTMVMEAPLVTYSSLLAS